MDTTFRFSNELFRASSQDNGGRECFGALSKDIETLVSDLFFFKYTASSQKVGR